MYYFAKNAVIEGDVTLGEDVNIWHHAVIRGDINAITIGERTNIQDLCVVHVTHEEPVTIGAGVVVGHSSIIHGCTVEDDVLIGMGSILMDGCVIGKGSVIGAGSLVTEGTVIPEGMLALGRPARVIRPVDANLLDETRQGVLHYIENAKESLERGE